MASDQPFTPITGATVGKSVIVLATSSASTAGTVVCNVSVLCNNMLVTNPMSGVTLFVRLSTEASPTATTADLPVPPGSSRLTANPAPTGTAGVAVILASLSLGSNGQNCFAIFTPGNQGVE